MKIVDTGGAKKKVRVIRNFGEGDNLYDWLTVNKYLKVTDERTRIITLKTGNIF